MRKVQRAEILPLAVYEAERPVMRKRIFDIKAKRRIHVGEYLMFLFENADTMRYQVQEMLRIEGHEQEKDILHELGTYNDLLGDENELGCTLMIEIDDKDLRDEYLRAWLPLPKHLFLVLDNGERVGATFDDIQVGDDRLSSVQYLKFACGDASPVAIECDLPGLESRLELTAEQRAALAADLERETPVS